MGKTRYSLDELNEMYYKGFADGMKTASENIINELTSCKKIANDLDNGEIFERAFQMAIEIVQNKIIRKE